MESSTCLYFTNFYLQNTSLIAKTDSNKLPRSDNIKHHKKQLQKARQSSKFITLYNFSNIENNPNSHILKRSCIFFYILCAQLFI